MKKIIFFVLFSFGIKTAFADCGMEGMQFFPEQKEISLNSMFIIQGYLSSQKTIESFKKRKVYLESETGELIELSLQKIYISHKYLTQAIFRTKKELRPNIIYFLKYSDQTENEEKEMMKYNREKKENEKVYWKTSEIKKLETLNINLSINFNKTEIIHYECGPSVNAIFKIKI